MPYGTPNAAYNVSPAAPHGGSASYTYGPAPHGGSASYTYGPAPQGGTASFTYGAAPAAPLGHPHAPGSTTYGVNTGFDLSAFANPGSFSVQSGVPAIVPAIGLDVHGAHEAHGPLFRGSGHLD